MFSYLTASPSYVEGGDGSDVIQNASTGNDTIYGGDGTDYMSGADGDDTVFGDFSADDAVGGADVSRGAVRNGGALPRDISICIERATGP